MSEEETVEESSPVPMTVGLIIVTIVLGFVAWHVMGQYDTYEYDRLNDALDNKINVSDDYRQGWLDCIAKLKSIRTEMSNVTNMCS